jgi:hypothetical protein
MRIAFGTPSIALLAAAFVVYGLNAKGQSSQNQTTPQTTPATHSIPASQQGQTPDPQRSSAGKSHQSSPGGDVGHGSGDIGKGAAKGTGEAAKGVGKGVGDLATLHPIDAAGNVAKGGAKAGKDIGVGTAKGTAKIAKGTGRGVGKLFHHHHDKGTVPEAPEPQN